MLAVIRLVQYLIIKFLSFQAVVLQIAEYIYSKTTESRRPIGNQEINQSFAQEIK